MPESRECHSCHRVGYRGFVPMGDYGWVCANELGCIAKQARSDTQAAIKRTAQQINVQIERKGHADPALVGDLLFLILGPNDRGQVMPDATRL